MTHAARSVAGYAFAAGLLLMPFSQGQGVTASTLAFAACAAALGLWLRQQHESTAHGLARVGLNVLPALLPLGVLALRQLAITV